MRTAIVIAGKEMRDGMRNRWVVATTVLMAACGVGVLQLFRRLKK